MATLLFTTEEEQKALSLENLRKLVLLETESFDKELWESKQHIIRIENSLNDFFRKGPLPKNNEDKAFMREGGFYVKNLPELNEEQQRNALFNAKKRAGYLFTDAAAPKESPISDDIIFLQALLRQTSINQEYTLANADRLQTKQHPDISRILRILERMERVELQERLERDKKSTGRMRIKKLLKYSGIYAMIELSFTGLEIASGIVSPELRDLFSFVQSQRMFMRFTCIPVFVQHIIESNKTIPDPSSWRTIREIIAAAGKMTTMRMPLWIVGMIGNPFSGSIVGAIVFTGFIAAGSSVVVQSFIDKVVLYDQAVFTEVMSDSINEKRKHEIDIAGDLARSKSGYSLGPAIAGIPDANKLSIYRDLLFTRYTGDAVKLLVGASCGYALAKISMENAFIDRLTGGALIAAADSIFFKLMAVPATIALSSRGLADLYSKFAKKYMGTTYRRLIPERFRKVIDRQLTNSYAESVGSFLYFLYASIGSLWLSSFVFNADSINLLVSSMRTESYQTLPIEDLSDPEILSTIFGRRVNQEAINTYIPPASIKMMDELSAEEWQTVLNDFLSWEALHDNQEHLPSVDLLLLSRYFQQIDGDLKSDTLVVNENARLLDEIVKTKFPDAQVVYNIYEITESEFAGISDDTLANFERHFGRSLVGSDWQTFSAMREEIRPASIINVNALWETWKKENKTVDGQWKILNERYASELEGIITDSISELPQAAGEPIRSIDEKLFDEPTIGFETLSARTIEQQQQLLPEVKMGLQTSVSQFSRKTAIALQALIPEINEAFTEKKITDRSLSIFLDMLWGGLTSNIDNMFSYIKGLLVDPVFSSSILESMKKDLEKFLSGGCIPAYATIPRLHVNEEGIVDVQTTSGAPIPKRCIFKPPIYILYEKVINEFITAFSYSLQGLLIGSDLFFAPLMWLLNLESIRNPQERDRLMRITALELLEKTEDGIPRTPFKEAVFRLLIAYSCAGQPLLEGSVCGNHAMFFNPAAYSAEIFSELLTNIDPFLKLNEATNTTDFIENYANSLKNAYGTELLAAFIAGTPDVSRVFEYGKVIVDDFSAIEFIVTIQEFALEFLKNALFRR